MAKIYKEIRDQIRSFRDLPNGWHYGEGCGATEQAVEAALVMHSKFLKSCIRTIEVFPDVDGGILVAGYIENNTIEVFCDQGGRANLLHEINDEARYEKDDVSIEEIVRYLGGLTWKFGSLFDFFILYTTANTSDDLLALHSKTHQAVEGSRLLTLNAPEKRAERNAHTYGAFISHNPQEIHPFFGVLTSPIYRKELWSQKNDRVPAISVM